MKFKKTLILSIALCLCLCLIKICLAEGNITIKSVKRLPKQKYVLNEHEDLIGARYNKKFYSKEEEQKNIVFYINIENQNLQPFTENIQIPADQSQEGNS